MAALRKRDFSKAGASEEDVGFPLSEPSLGELAIEECLLACVENVDRVSRRDGLVLLDDSCRDGPGVPAANIDDGVAGWCVDLGDNAGGGS
jgi:hypothetical protein